MGIIPPHEMQNVEKANYIVRLIENILMYNASKSYEKRTG